MASEQETLVDIENEPVVVICEEHGPIGSTEWFANDPERAAVNFARLHLIKQKFKNPLTGPGCEFKVAEVDDAE